MPIAFGQTAWIDDVALALERQIAVSGALPRDRVFLYLGRADDLAKNPQGERFASIGFRTQRADLGIVAGGGKEHSAWDASALVNVFARLGTDREMQDARLLKDRSNGVAALVRKVAAAVQLFTGAKHEDGNASWFVQPSRIHGITWNPRPIATGWAWAEIELGLKFRTDLTTAGASG